MTKPVGKDVLNQYGIMGWKRKRLSKGLRKHRRWQKAQDRKNAFARLQERKRHEEALAKLPDFNEIRHAITHAYREPKCPHCSSSKYASTGVMIKTKQGRKKVHQCDNCHRYYR